MGEEKMSDLTQERDAKRNLLGDAFGHFLSGREMESTVVDLDTNRIPKGVAFLLYLVHNKRGA
jgi:hypothetical protein